MVWMIQETQRNHRELLELAYQEGYFEVPRETSLVELAEELGYTNQEASAAIREALNECLSDDFE
jgi:predicted DNA binding protein